MTLFRDYSAMFKFYFPEENSEVSERWIITFHLKFDTLDAVERTSPLKTFFDEEFLSMDHKYSSDLLATIHPSEIQLTILLSDFLKFSYWSKNFRSFECCWYFSALWNEIRWIRQVSINFVITLPIAITVIINSTPGSANAWKITQTNNT